MKHLKQPKRQEQNPFIDHKQDFFASGMYPDPATPASEIPSDAVRWVLNVLLYPDYAEVRPGTERHSALLPPFIEGRTNYVATKTGKQIVKTAGQDFTVEDIDNYFWWPQSGRRDLITGFVSANAVTVKHDTAEGPSTSILPAKLMPPENAARFWHSASKKLFALFGSDIYWTTWSMDAWNKLPLHSSRDVANAISSSYSLFDANKSIVYLINPFGVFAVDTTKTPMETWKTNSVCQDNTISEVGSSTVNLYGARYLTSLSRLTNGFVTESRLNKNLVIQQESGSNNINLGVSSEDFKEVWGANLTGQITTSYQELVGAVTLQPLAAWNLIVNGGFKAALNGSTYTEISSLNFSACANLDDCAAVVQIGLKTVWVNATCVYNAITNKFTLTGGIIPPATVDALTSPSSGATDISDAGYLEMTASQGAIHNLSNTSIIGRSIGPITYPSGSRHWTHIPIYKTNDLSKETTSSERYVLADEIPIAKAFDAYRDNADGHIHISPGGNGEFNLADVYNPFKFADGTTDTITGYISGTEVAGTGVLVAVPGQGAAIGNGRVMTARQTGTHIYRTTGDSFIAADVGRRVWWADGYYSFIVEYVDADEVVAEVSSNHTQQGMTLAPSQRYFNDYVTDADLDSRANLWPLFARFWQPLPVLDTGIIVPGFIIVSRSGVDEIHYSMLTRKREYLGGYYNEYFQMMPAKDKIKHFSEFKDLVVVYCANSTYWIATNTTMSQEIPDIGEFVSVLTGLNLLDAKIGVLDVGSIEKLPNGLDVMVTSEPGLRKCNGNSFGPNLAVDEYGRSFVLNDLQKAQQKTASGYDANKLGYLLFFSDEAPDN